MENRTLFIIKPNAMAAKAEGKILDILLSNGFDLKRLQLLKLDKATAEAFYAEHRSKPFFDSLVEFMTTEEVLVGVLQKEGAVADLRLLVGNTDPMEAAEGTIRRIFGTDRTQNAIHASDSPVSAAREEDLLFSKNSPID